MTRAPGDDLFWGTPTLFGASSDGSEKYPNECQRRAHDASHHDIHVATHGALCTDNRRHTVMAPPPHVKRRFTEPTGARHRPWPSSQKRPARAGAHTLSQVKAPRGSADVSQVVGLQTGNSHWHAACFCCLVVKEVGLWKVLLGIALVLLPGSLLILPLVVLIAGRRDLQKGPREASLQTPSPVTGSTDLGTLTAGDAPSVRIATV